MVAREPAEGDSAGDIGTRAPIERSRACLLSLRAALASAGAAPGIEPGTSRTRCENHATRPSSLVAHIDSTHPKHHKVRVAPLCLGSLLFVMRQEGQLGWGAPPRWPAGKRPRSCPSPEWRPGKRAGNTAVRFHLSAARCPLSICELTRHPGGCSGN